MLTNSIFLLLRQMDSAIEALTKNLENGGYFRQANPKDFDAEDFFKGFDDKRRARAVWTTTVIPRLISSKHPTLQRTGVALQRRWNSKSYRRRLNQALEQEEIVLSSVHKHQTRILDHSYKDLCHILKKREATFKESEDSTGHLNTTESDHIGTKVFGQNSATVGEQAYDGPPSDSLVSETVIDRALVESTNDTTGQVSEAQDDSGDTGNETGDNTDDLSLVRYHSPVFASRVHCFAINLSLSLHISSHCSQMRTARPWQIYTSNFQIIRSLFQAERFLRTFYFPTELPERDISMCDAI
ncbi:unnamed protein product [Mortierella alpina]